MNSGPTTAFRGSRRDTLALTALTLSLLTCAEPLFGQPRSPSTDENFSEVAASMQRRIDSGPTPSIAIAVARGGKVVWEHAFGKSDIERQQAATANTPYYIASITKTITATALTRLAAQKKVDLDKPVNTYLRGAKITSPLWNVSQVTLRRLANHTAGLATYGHDCLVNDTACDPSPLTAIRRYGVAVWKPGEMFDYSNLGYGILGEVVAQTSGTDLDGALRRLVFTPLGLSSCSVGPDLTLKKGQASRYAIGAPPLKKSVSRSSTPGASGVYCSVHDLAMFGSFHLKDHAASQQRILSDEAISEMQAPSLDPKEQQQYGRAWWIQKDLHGYHGVLAQGGTNDSTAYLQLIPAEDIAVAVLVNTYIDGAAIVDEVLATLLPEYRKNLTAAASVSKPPPPAPQTAPAQFPPELAGSWTGFVGTYKGKVPLTVTIEPTGHVMAKIAEQPEAPVTRARFVNQVFRGAIGGSLGVEGEPFTLALKLFFRDGLLVGDAETSPLPTNPPTNWIQTYYWVQLKSDQ